MLLFTILFVTLVVAPPSSPATPSNTFSPTRTPFPTGTPTLSQTPLPTISPTRTAFPTGSAPETQSPTPLPTSSPTRTAFPTSPPTTSPTGTSAPTSDPTSSPTPSFLDIGINETLSTFDFVFLFNALNFSCDSWSQETVDELLMSVGVDNGTLVARGCQEIAGGIVRALASSSQQVRQSQAILLSSILESSPFFKQLGGLVIVESEASNSVLIAATMGFICLLSVLTMV